MAEFDSVIPAGESGTLTARIKTATTQSGPVSKSVSVTTDAPGAQRLTLNIRFQAVTAISVLPRPQVTLSGITGDATSQTLVLRRGDGESLEITGLEVGDERLVVTTEKVVETREIGRSEARPGDVLLTVSTAEGLGAVSAGGKIAVTTNHPDAARVEVAYAIRLRPVIEARPAQLRLILQEGNSSARMALTRITNHRRQEFKVTGVEISNPELLHVNLVNGDVKQQVHNVAVMIRDGVEPGSIADRTHESLVFLTDDPDEPEVMVSVLVEPREVRRPSRPRPLE